MHLKSTLNAALYCFFFVDQQGNWPTLREWHLVFIRQRVCPITLFSLFVSLFYVSHDRVHTSHRHSLSRTLSIEIGTPAAFCNTQYSTPLHSWMLIHTHKTHWVPKRNSRCSHLLLCVCVPVQVGFASYERKLQVYLLYYLIGVYMLVYNAMYNYRWFMVIC